MKIFNVLSVFMLFPLVAFGAGRSGTASGGVSRVGLAGARATPVAVTANLKAQSTFANFELSDTVKQQIAGIVSNQASTSTAFGKIELGDAAKTQIGEIVSNQIIKDKNIGKVDLGDAAKKQIGDLLSKQFVNDGGLLKLELNDMVKKQIGDLLSGHVIVGGDPCPGCFAVGTVGATGSNVQADSSLNCREAYRKCMDDFCLLDENQGERCACSDNINRAKTKLQEVLDIQAEADKLFSEGVEREKLGAKVNLVFTEETSGNAKVSGKTFMAWLTGVDGNGEVGEDLDIGDNLYYMAANYCQSELKACNEKAEMEEMLYTRLIAQDCKTYDAYLKEQKANAESNKRIAESAVRQARFEMLDTTNKYNRGECLLAYRSCIADKGGCGANFENCLDAKLLARRSNACENILDQCMVVRDYVKQDWEEESKSVLEEATKYADKNRRGTCLARVQDCLEESCSTSTDSLCLSDVNVAAGICPVITECDEIVPGFRAGVNDKLAYLRTKFCENDIDKCLQDKCGVDFTKPECVGKQPYEIAQLCPQSMFPSCKNAEQFDIIVQSAILQMDYQLLQGCINYYAEKLADVCGTDMKCLPDNAVVASLTVLPKAEEELLNLRSRVIESADASVDDFFAQFEQEKTVSACMDSQTAQNKKIRGKNSLRDSVFLTAKWKAKNYAQNRGLRALNTRIAELTRAQDVETARKTCLTTYKKEKPDDSKSNYMYIKSVAFEPSLRNCHVCRMQQVCEEGGESKGAAALKGAGGGVAAGASAGTMANAGWGTAIGAAVGAIGGGVLGAISGGKKKYCQEVESCEDINMGTGSSTPMEVEMQSEQMLMPISTVSSPKVNVTTLSNSTLSMPATFGM